MTETITKSYLPTKYIRPPLSPERRKQNSDAQKKRWAKYHEELKKNNSPVQNNNIIPITTNTIDVVVNGGNTPVVNNYNGVTDNDGVDNKDNNLQTLNNSQNNNTNNTNNTNLSSISDKRLTFKDFTSKIVPKMQRLTVSILDNLTRQAKYQGTVKSQDSTALAIIIDKLQLLTGRATSNISVVRYTFNLKRDDAPVSH